MKKQFTTTKNRHLIGKWRMISMSLLSLALVMSSGFLPVTAALKNQSDRLSITLGNNIVPAKILSKADIPVKGKITDQKSGEALIGVSVKVKGTNSGVSTDANGNYSLNAPENGTLVITYIGYETVEVAVNNRENINIPLVSSNTSLGEVVVIGYGTVKKKDLTGSVSSITAERLLDKPAFNVAQAMQGKVAGVKIIERSGAPGGAPMIRIRGTNSINSNNEPLFVVDGIVGVRDAMLTLDPNQIESIDVLKDASATAIYGARGSNGVIIIQTKRGKAGKTQVEYSSYAQMGVSKRHYNVLNADQLMYVYEQAWANVQKYATAPNRGMDFRGATAAGLSYSEMGHLFRQVNKGEYLLDLVGKDGKYYAPRFNTNWENEILRSSFSNNNQVNIRGGNENAKFGLFLGNSNEQGLLIESSFDRYSGKITGDIKANKWLDVSTNLSFLKTKESTSDEPAGINTPRSAVESWSILPVRYPDDPSIYGKYAGQWGTNPDFPTGEDITNPVHAIAEKERFTNRNQVTGDVTLNFKITKDLSLKSNLAVDAYYYKFNQYGGRAVLGQSAGSQGTANIDVSNTFYWQVENYFNYVKNIGNHSINGLVGSSQSKFRFENLNTSNQYFFDDFYKWHNIGVGTAPRPAPSSSDGMSALNSYFARANYGYKGKYLLTLTGRYDGSSKFGKNSKYGFFPSAGAAWKISEEDFIKKIDAISNLKLRASIGQTGNQEIGSYVTQTYIGSGNVVMGGVTQPGLFQGAVGNPDLKWETTTQYNGGIDIGLWNDRINLAVDYYNKLTTDMLLDVPLPQSTTVGSVKLNYGTIENKGWEFALNTHNIRGRNFNWYSDVIFTANRNKIVKLGPTGADILRNGWVGGSNTILRVGEPIASFWGLNRLGTYSTEEASLAARYNLLPGDVKYEDKNGDGLISFGADGGILGSAFPKVEMGINNNFTYNNFDLSVDIRIVEGAKKQDRTNHSAEDRQLISNGKNSILNSWRPDYQNTDQAQVRPGFGGAYYQTYPDTHWIQDASFIRGEGATLGYTFTESVLNKIGVQKLRAYLNTRNFFVSTKYTGYDPEGSSSDVMDSLTPSMDFYMYPRPTTYSFGVNLIF